MSDTTLDLRFVGRAREVRRDWVSWEVRRGSLGARGGVVDILALPNFFSNVVKRWRVCP